MPYDNPAKRMVLDSPRDRLEAEFARINSAFDAVMPKTPDRWLTGVNSFEGLADSVRLERERRLRPEDR